MKNIRYTFYLISSDKSTNKMVEFGRGTFRFLLTLLIMIIVTIIISYFVLVPKFVKFSSLKKEIVKYKNNEATYLSMMNDYESMKAMNKYVRELIGISEFDEIDANSLLRNDINNGIDNIEDISISLENIPTKAPVSGIITQEFKEGVNGENVHNGIDISGPIGTPISASAGGLVVFSGWTNDLGNLIVIVHNNKYVTVYGHNSENIVKEKQIVKKGQLIALLGNSGQSTGPHLHFEIWKNAEAKNPREFITEYEKKD